MKHIADRINEWAKSNQWYSIEVQTNQMRLDNVIGKAVHKTLQTLEYHGKTRLRNRLSSSYDKLKSHCRQIDLICRSGCRCNEEYLDLEFLRIKAMASASELAEIFSLLENMCSTESTLKPKSVTEDSWIKFSEAAEILMVSVSTISKWNRQGKFRDNDQKGRNRRLLKSSVLLVKEQIENEQRSNDLRELQRDAARIR